ncbi:hypothetical protein [Bradyrhizobium sp. SBR1B]|uniref:hypothetical protein n=1 Tax=Bradyrhizobium sp. SBR1B TaxID=2663836 RepID=UPI0016058748|nr:hypothetical protein [Bradyrhizobium sp. SBR1B]MBB4375628.1 hypothetical protein [Bradyrhizobium sp. SBR1B]
MKFDLDDPRWTQRQFIVAGVADDKTINNYIQLGHLKPHRIQGRRMFTALQAIEVGLTAKLATICSLPPSTGKQLARGAILGADGAWLRADAESGRGKLTGQKWIAASSHRQQVYIRKNAKGETVVSNEDETGEAVALIFPFQIFARSILVGLEKSAEAD